MDDIVLNKAAITERCLRRIDEEYEGDAETLEGDLGDLRGFAQRALALSSD